MQRSGERTVKSITNSLSRSEQPHIDGVADNQARSYDAFAGHQYACKVSRTRGMDKTVPCARETLGVCEDRPQKYRSGDTHCGDIGTL